MPVGTDTNNTGSSGGFNWTDLVNAALAIYGAGKGSGSTPNFYTAPLTPGEEWVQGAKKNLFDYSGAYTDQFLRGMGNMNPSWAPTSPLLGANTGGFMGGVKVPTIDWSKMPSRPTSAGTGAVTPPTTGTPGIGSSAEDPTTGIPGYGRPDPFANWPQNPNAHNVTWDDIKNTFGDNGVALGKAIITANPTATMMGLWNLLMGLSGNGQLPTNHLDPNKMDLAPAGTKPSTYPMPIEETIQGPRNVTVGGSLGDPGKAPPGWSLDNPFDWYNQMYGGAGGSSDPMSGQAPSRKPRF